MTAVGLVSLACAPPLTPPSVRGDWAKPGVDARQMRRDLYECERHAVTADHGEPSLGLFEQCMRSRGYAPKPPPDQ
jgi:hypothetical protein